jgi:hypothetical protein
MVYFEDHTPANEHHARSSGNPQYAAAAALPTVDKNQKKVKEKQCTVGDFMRQQGVTRCHGNSKQFFVNCFSTYIKKNDKNMFCLFIYTN